MLMYHYRVVPHNMIIYPERWGSNGPGIRPGITLREINSTMCPGQEALGIPGIPGIPGMDKKKISSTVKTIRVVEVRLNELQFLNSR